MYALLSAVRIINAVAIELFTLIAARRRRRRMIVHMLRTQIAANSIPIQTSVHLGTSAV